MHLEFTKMHGLGNDFIVINALQDPFPLTVEQIRTLSHRRFGIGFDQLLVVEPASVVQAEFDYRIFNADGGEVENCGNGARCFARYVIDKGLTKNNVIAVQTSGGLMRLQVDEDSQVTVQIGVPEFQPAAVPFIADEQRSSYEIEAGSETLTVGVVAVGNPHVVTVVDSTINADVDRLGPLLERHERFPNRVNAGFMQVLSKSEVNLRVFERGVGETLACGTGACAAVATGIRQGILDERVVVHLTGGDLVVNWSDDNVPISMTGPCATVFEGRLEL
ncbi:diaminopimelate epimerase [Chromatiales bacterium (ex Bugula neritina AB1)]|nr:diaminopimelate epimerase [Chromatiales bacterium (ex Bugula neritina AB1)]